MLLIRLAVSAIAVVVLLAIIPIGDILAALGRFSFWTWFFGFGVFVGGHCLNALKLHLLLARSAPLRDCLRAQFAGLLANLGLPGLSGGDVVRAAYLVPSAGLKRVAVASVSDRLIDVGTMVVLIAVSLPVAGVPPDIAELLRQASPWIVGGVVLIVLALAIARVRRKPRNPGALGEKIRAVLSGRQALLAAAAISLFVQTTFVLTNAWLGSQAGVTTGVAAWFVAWPLSKLIAVLPISLGGMGVREAALVTLLVPYGAARGAVLASGILWQAVVVLSGLSGFVITQIAPFRKDDPQQLRPR